MGTCHDPLFFSHVKGAEGVIRSVSAALFPFMSTLAVGAVDTLYFVGFFVLFPPTVSSRMGSCTEEASTVFHVFQFAVR